MAQGEVRPQTRPRARVELRDTSGVTPTISEAAVRAAVTVAARFTVNSTEPVVLADGANVVVHLRPAPVVAKVAASTPEVRPRVRDWLQRELDVSAFLAAEGAPVVPASSELPATVQHGDGHVMSFWRYLPPTGSSRERRVASAARRRRRRQPHGHRPGLALAPLRRHLLRAAGLGPGRVHRKPVPGWPTRPGRLRLPGRPPRAGRLRAVAAAAPDRLVQPVRRAPARARPAGRRAAGQLARQLKPLAGQLNRT